MARRRTFYPTAKPKGPQPAPREYVVPPTVAIIDSRAALGRQGIRAGMRVRILGTGLYAGEIAVVEKLLGGPIPAASVRTEAGRTRRVRTIDLEPATAAPQRPAGSAPGDDAATEETGTEEAAADGAGAATG